MADKPQQNMPPPDTPPASPADLNYQKPNRRITIDDNGVHDFDFKKRHEQPGPRKLQKFSRRSDRRSAPSQRSISSIADMKITTDSVPHRTPSDGSEHGSIKKRFSTLLRKSSKETLHKTNSARSQNSIDVQDDPLPETKKDLEIRLNYHLSELDLLKKTLQAANDMIRQHQERFEILQTRSDVDMRNAMIKQERMVDIARSNRNSYVEFVSFHRRQIERIRHKRIEIELNAGVEPTLPQVYKQMWGDDEWIKLFAP